MTHNDFRPYNIIGDTVIDFGRSEELSSDPIERQNQILKDDETAEGEWSYFVARRDVYAIEKNPFLPNSKETAIKSWKFYTDRYPGQGTKRYQEDWMETLDYILTNNDTSVDFPTKDQYE
jgi:hypothetical protein